MVAALKRVTEKLKAENERLRKSAADGAGRADAERVAKEAKKRVTALEEEAEKLKTKARQADDAVHRLAQKQVTHYTHALYANVSRGKKHEVIFFSKE